MTQYEWELIDGWELIDKLNGNLVGGFNHLEKYEHQWEGLSHIWKIKNVTTNRECYIEWELIDDTI